MLNTIGAICSYYVLFQCILRILLWGDLARPTNIFFDINLCSPSILYAFP